MYVFSLFLLAGISCLSHVPFTFPNSSWSQTLKGLPQALSFGQLLEENPLALISGDLSPDLAPPALQTPALARSVAGAAKAPFLPSYWKR